MFAPLLLAASAFAPPPADAPPVPTAAELLKTAVPLDAPGVVFLDAKNRRVLVKGEVVLRRGALEMLVCLPETKEHESVLRFDGDARTLHAGLVALGLEPGSPVRFSPEFAPRPGRSSTSASTGRTRRANPAPRTGGNGSARPPKAGGRPRWRPCRRT